MRRRFYKSMKRLEDFLIRFYPAGTYTWTVPDGCTEVDVFLVGGGGGSYNNKGGSGGGGGYTKTFKKATDGWRDGNAISVIPGQKISIIVGKGGVGSSRSSGGYSQFLNSNYRANGGDINNQNTYTGGNGGSGGGSDGDDSRQGGSDGGDGSPNASFPGKEGKGQGHTTRDFGETTGKRNAGGGGGSRGAGSGGASDYEEGTGGNNFGGGGYGGGAGGGWYSQPGGSPYANGGDGTVLIRGKRFKQ